MAFPDLCRSRKLGVVAICLMIVGIHPMVASQKKSGEGVEKRVGWKFRKSESEKA